MSECIAVVLHLTHENIEDQPRHGTAGSWSHVVQQVYTIAAQRTHGDPANIQRIELQGVLGMPEEYRCYLEPGGDFVALYAVMAAPSYVVVYREDDTVSTEGALTVEKLPDELRRLRYWGDVLAIIPLKDTDRVRSHT